MRFLVGAVLVVVLVACATAFESDAETFKSLVVEERKCHGDGSKGCATKPDDWCCKNTPCKCPAWSSTSECRCAMDCSRRCKGKRALLLPVETHRLLFPEQW
uniref:U1-sicaritoxin-Li1a n=1 Tax=Loxosceles intermedia TaxID=58218 RepID=TX1_LOXIN|nr:RecName: Full=U1-sicaritoxin-Li1a; Short=U1-SCRTX-Li1a; AltName: Full=LiTx1; Flags: Precursor [Loxosceles intermedia]AAT85610.1 toxin 1 [Loxosceles intermedia]